MTRKLSLGEERRSDELVGRLEEVTMVYFRYNIGAIMTQVQMGKVFVLTQQGKPTAVLSRVPGENLVIDVSPTGRISYSLATQLTGGSHERAS